MSGPIEIKTGDIPIDRDKPPSVARALGRLKPGEWFEVGKSHSGAISAVRMFCEEARLPHTFKTTYSGEIVYVKRIDGMEDEP